MRRKLVFATGNEGKMKEIREILKELDLEICSLKEAGIQMDAEENGTTFEENALIKARAAAAHADAIVMADDSGLEIDYLGGEPGVYSARYLGEDTSYRIKNQNLIDRLEGVPDEKRTARFVCVIAAVLPDGRTLTSRGTIEGIIGREERGGEASGMIRFSSCRNMDALQQNFPWSRKMRSATGESPSGDEGKAAERAVSLREVHR